MSRVNGDKMDVFGNGVGWDLNCGYLGLGFWGF